ncbi:CIC11C00000001671 [Sungouiella intermedia]|uniref:CIC11C00000001671 n=1 Tax=Sungouiella intermedia TaxID=45354 RepID=A0A1L0G5B8_9ASCO|nr:CIC11C00000001671 [[Candida] intermedia]
MVHSHIHPGRIWSLLPSQEIALKQFWAILLKSFGYEINLSNEDIKFARGLVSSVDMSNYEGSAALTISVSKYESSVESETLSLRFQNSCNNIKSVYYLLETESYADDDGDVFRCTIKSSTHSWPIIFQKTYIGVSLLIVEMRTLTTFFFAFCGIKTSM